MSSAATRPQRYLLVDDKQPGPRSREGAVGRAAGSHGLRRQGHYALDPGVKSYPAAD